MHSQNSTPSTLCLHERPNGAVTGESNTDKALRAENKTTSLALESLAEAFTIEELNSLRATVERDNVILDKRSKHTSFKPADEVVKFQVHPTDAKKTASISTQLDLVVDEALLAFPHENWEISTWHPSCMPNIPRRLIEHSLNIIEGFKKLANRRSASSLSQRGRVWARNCPSY
jgi:hypothetical protein